jgi:uncharacterized protein (DUF1330 family)
MAAQGYVNPGKTQFRALVDAKRDEGPIFMINLLRFRERAAYPPGHKREKENLTGREAYRLYGEESEAVFTRLGGRQVWAGDPKLVVTGPEDEHWDLAFIAEYPTVQAFLDMLADPAYREAVVNRTAAVADSRLIRCLGLAPAKGFMQA